MISRILTCLLLATTAVPLPAQESVARLWNEQCLAAIRRDFPAPTVHARNLFHLSAAMYDAWAAYDPAAVGVFHNENATAADIAAARDEAISHASYRVLTSRYDIAVGAGTTLTSLAAQMAALGYPLDDTLTGPSPAAVGNRCADAILTRSLSDGSNEKRLYADNTGYHPVNDPMILKRSGSGPLDDPNRWQPLAFEFAFTQNGLVASKIQSFVGPNWGFVTPFALTGESSDGVYADFDPGLPPQLGGVGDADFKSGTAGVIRFSSLLDPSSTATIDISPGALGNNPLGTNDGSGHPVNPVTGSPYPPNSVKHADFGRVIAEYWADGPESETPPGHWNVLANEVSDTPGFEKKFQGEGELLDDLEWDVKLYFVLNAALHDSAVAAWGVKAHYDYVRPITAIRYLGGLGQSSDPLRPSYHPDGLPLIPDLIELVTPETSAAEQRHEGLFPGTIAIRAWKGEPGSTDEISGVGWIEAEDWMPYQRATFVTPAFAGYVSGHSTFSRAAAEILTFFTGSPYFPGGIGRHTAEADSLAFEFGPSAPVELQWASYYDAADQAGISRLYGGIHFAVDDGPGRIIGAKVGRATWQKALPYLDGSILDEIACELTASPSQRVISWDCLPGYHYKVQWSETLEPEDFQDLTSYQSYASNEASAIDDSFEAPRRFYRVIRIPAP